jgi:hypothetical protein
MNTRYNALLSPITDPVVLYVAATFGMAESTEVLAIGDSNPVQDMTIVMTIFLLCENLPNSSTGASALRSLSAPLFFSGWAKLIGWVGSSFRAERACEKVEAERSRNCRTNYGKNGLWNS